MIFGSFLICFAGDSLEYFFQSSFPCFYCLCFCDHSISIGEFAVFCYFTDQCVGNGKFTHFISWNFHDDITKSRCKEISWIQIVLDFYTKGITECHFGNSCSNTMAIQCIGRNNFASLNVTVEFFVLIHDSCIVWQIVLILRCTKPYQSVTCFFQFRSNNILDLCHIYCKRYQCRRYIDLIECTGHTVFTTD